LTPAEAVINRVSRWRIIQITLLAWFAVISLDYFMNAGLLARFYNWNLPGFLSPLKMFQYIPLGYACFLLWCILLVWLMTRLFVSGFRAGAIFGMKVGILLSVAGFLGQMSIFDFPAWMFLLWIVPNTLSFTVAGAVAGAGLAATHLRPLVLRVAMLFLVCFIGGTVMQNIGPNPAAKMFSGPAGISMEKNR
jgi:hypothetical protein